MLSFTAGQPSTPALGTKASAGRWLWELVEEKKGSLGCRSGRLRRGLGAALDVGVSAGEEKGWVSWAGKTLLMPVQRACPGVARPGGEPHAPWLAAPPWPGPSGLGITRGSEQAGRPGEVRAWAEPGTARLGGCGADMQTLGRWLICKGVLREGPVLGV